MIGLTVETVVNSSTDPGPTRFPIWALAIPAIPSMGRGDLGEAEVESAFSQGGLSGEDLRLAATMFASATATPDSAAIRFASTTEPGLGRSRRSARKFPHADRIIEVLLAKGILFGRGLTRSRLMFAAQRASAGTHLGVRLFHVGFGLCQA